MGAVDGRGRKVFIGWADQQEVKGVPRSGPDVRTGRWRGGADWVSGGGSSSLGDADRSAHQTGGRKPLVMITLLRL